MKLAKCQLKSFFRALSNFHGVSITYGTGDGKCKVARHSIANLLVDGTIRPCKVMPFRESLYLSRLSNREASKR